MFKLRFERRVGVKSAKVNSICQGLPGGGRWEDLRI